MRDERKDLLYSVLGMILLILAAVFTNSYSVSGILTCLGMVSFLNAERSAHNKKEFLQVMLFLWLGHYIRYIRIFGNETEYYAVFLAVMLIYTAVLAVAFAADHYVVVMKKIPLGVVVFPVMYTLFIYLGTNFGLGNIFCLSLYITTIPVISQCNAVISQTGMLFLSTLLMSLLSYMFCEKQKRKISVICFGTVVAVMLVFGFVRLNNQKEADYTLRVATATTIEASFTGDDEAAEKEEFLKTLENALAEAKDGGAQLLVTNEEYFTVKFGDREWCKEKIAEVIKKYQIPVLLGIEYVTAEGELNENTVDFYDKDGNVISSYWKHTLIPVIEKPYYKEGYETPGTVTYRFGDNEVNISYIICFDINNISYLENVQDNTELLIAPSWDWDTANLEQRHSFVRAIEYDTTLLKHTMDGFTFVSGPYGLCGDIIDNRGRFEKVAFVDVPIWEKGDIDEK